MIASAQKPSRPVLRYHGGKWLLAERVIEHFPAHHIYTEAFGGAASVLIQKSRCYCEVYNDLDGEIVNLFRVLQSPLKASALDAKLRLTPFARQEFELAYQPSDDDMEQARRTIIKSFMGFGSSAITKHTASDAGFRLGAKHYIKPSTGFRANSNRSGTVPAHDWANYPDALEAVVERLRGVVIENRDASAVITHHDDPRTLHYVDPPYVHSTRQDNMQKNYRFEMTENDHRALGETLSCVEGMVVISGYACALYDEEIYKDWFRVEREALADGARPRIEVLWLNASAHKRLQSEQSQEVLQFA